MYQINIIDRIHYISGLGVNIWGRPVFLELYIIETAGTKVGIVSVYDTFHWPIHTHTHKSFICKVINKHFKKILFIGFATLKISNKWIRLFWIVKYSFKTKYTFHFIEVFLYIYLGLTAQNIRFELITFLSNRSVVFTSLLECHSATRLVYSPFYFYFQIRTSTVSVTTLCRCLNHTVEMSPAVLCYTLYTPKFILFFAFFVFATGESPTCSAKFT